MPSITNYIRFLPDRMYNVRLLLDRAGAIVERYTYDSYGRPRIRESCGRGDMNNDTKMSSGDTTRFDDANDDTIWDPRADMDDDGDVDANDETLYDNKYSDWSGAGPPVDPRQAFSDKGNPFMFQGIPHFALDTASSATEGKLMLNHHRARFADPVTGRWTTRDPLLYGSYESSLPTGIPNSLLAMRSQFQLATHFDSATNNPTYFDLKSIVPGSFKGIDELKAHLTRSLIAATPRTADVYAFVRNSPTTRLDPSGLSCHDGKTRTCSKCASCAPGKCPDPVYCKEWMFPCCHKIGKCCRGTVCDENDLVFNCDTCQFEGSGGRRTTNFCSKLGCD